MSLRRFASSTSALRGGLRRAAVLLAVGAASVGVLGRAAARGDDAPAAAGPVHVALKVTQNAHYGTYKATLDVGIGNLRSLPFVFDTGSSGLHVYADADLTRQGSGVTCSTIPTSVTYGNPPRIVFTGVVCYAPLQLGSFALPAPVPIAYLTAAHCPPNNPGCTIPNVNDPKAMGGYGIFGAGITGIMSGNGSVPNPILTIPGPRGSVFDVRLTEAAGDLVLGSTEPHGAATFQLAKGTRPGERWSLAQTCLFVDGRNVDACPLISFDTGNGQPFIHNVDSPEIPRDGDIVKPGTRIGFAPPGDRSQAASLVAGSSFATSIHLLDVQGGTPLTNPGIALFFDRVVTYDDATGTIGVSPAH